MPRDAVFAELFPRGPIHDRVYMGSDPISVSSSENTSSSVDTGFSGMVGMFQDSIAILLVYHVS